MLISPIHPAHGQTNFNQDSIIKPGPSRLILRPLAGDPNGPEQFLSRVHRAPLQWTMESHQVRSGLGSALGAVGDFNGDGQPDFAIGARKANGPENLPGWALLFSLEDQSNPNLVWWATDNRAESKFGHSVTGLGDLNGDGFSDLAVGAARFTRGGLGPNHSAGRVRIYLGGSNASPARHSWELEGLVPRAMLGHQIVAAGDLNGDGWPEMAISAPRSTDSFQSEGKVIVFYGSPTGFAAEPDWTAYGGSESAHFGTALAGGGDLNGDGLADLIVGAQRDSTAGEECGRVSVFYGSTEGLRAAPDWSFDGPGPSARLGGCVALIPDLNGDGLDELATGAPGANKNLDWPGVAFLFYGSKKGLPLQPDQTWRGEQSGCRLGAGLAGPGDVNGDGHADLLISAPEYDGTLENEGRVYLYLGSTQGFSDQPDWTVDGGTIHGNLGTRLARAGDLNGDGYADILIGSQFYKCVDDEEGRVDLFFGSPNGYQEGQLFPADGISAFVPGVTLADAESLPEIAARTLAQVPPDSSLMLGRPILWSVLALMVLLGCGLVGWIRRHQSRLQMVTANERQRLARDLHDGLGAQLTRLSLMEHPLAGTVEDVGKPPGQGSSISLAAREAIATMHEIVWSMEPSNDSLENLVAFLGQKANDLFANSSIECLTILPTHLPSMQVPRNVRSHLLYAVKEALHNALKHSQATQVKLQIEFASPWLIVNISDNGCGLKESNAARAKPSAQGGGNGLRNMRRRLEEMGGSFELAPVGSKFSCGIAVVEFQQASQTLSSLDLAG